MKMKKYYATFESDKVYTESEYKRLGYSYMRACKLLGEFKNREEARKEYYEIVSGGRVKHGRKA